MKKTVEAGDIFYTNEGYSVAVLSYTNKTDVLVQFQNESMHIIKTSLPQLRRGSIKNPFHRSVRSVGFIGVGSHVASIGGVHTKAYAAWKAMMTRCYSDLYQRDRPSYIGCKVEDSWHNFQVFADWFYAQPGFSSFTLDKDVLIKGNKVYGPETCCMIPSAINSLLPSRALARGELPIGVTKSKLRFSVHLNVRGERKYLGHRQTKESAFDLYKRGKQAYIRELVENDYADVLPDNVKDALLNYKVEITD